MKLKNIIIGISTFLITHFASALLEDITKTKLVLPINTVSLLIFSILVYAGTCIYSYIQKLRSENKKLSTQLKEYNDIGIDNSQTKNNRLFLISLTQDLYEPLKIKLLECAAKNNHVLSALYLGNIYSSGISEGKDIYIKKDSDKAFEIYKSIQQSDQYGVSDWMMGRLYEQNLITAAQGLSKNERLQKAESFYKSSAQKGFLKAENSLGKFYYYGWGRSKDIVKASTCFLRASEGYDVYGTINCGHLEMKQYRRNGDPHHLESAKNYFEKAAEFDNNEAYVQLGMVYEEYENYEKAKKCFLKALIGAKKQFNATSYYKLGCLINEHHIPENDSDIISLFKNQEVTDIAIECFKKSYELFQYCIINNIDVSGYYKQCYNQLVSSFKTLSNIQANGDDKFTSI